MKIKDTIIIFDLIDSSNNYKSLQRTFLKENLKNVKIKETMQYVV